MGRRSPTKVMVELEEVLIAITELAPDKNFGGVSLAQYAGQVGESKDARQDHINAKIQVKNAEDRRETSDDRGLRMRELIVNGIIGDPDFGPDSALYERCGYVRKSDRRSGLTRKGAKKD